MNERYRVTQLELEGIGQALDVGETLLESGRVMSHTDILIRAETARAALEEAGIPFEKAVRWLDTYQSLLNSGWRWQVAVYVAWASMPKSKRWPRSQEELARDIIGLNSDRAIATWRKKNPAIDELIAILQGNELLGARADVFDALATSASNPSYRNSADRRLFTQLTGDLIEATKITVNDGGAVKDFRSLSDAELLNMSGDKAKELLQRMREELQPNEDQE